MFRLLNSKFLIPRLLSKAARSPTNLKKQLPNTKTDTTLAKLCTSCGEQDDYAKDGYSNETESAMNTQITAELSAFFTYLTMSYHFASSTVALPGAQGFYMRMYEEELQHALILANYQTMRGGKVKLAPPEMLTCKFENICQALRSSLEMEKTIKKKLTDLLKIAEKSSDLTTVDFITTGLLQEQDQSICELARLFTRVKKLSDGGVGEFLLDKELHTAFVTNKNKLKSPENDLSLEVYK